MVRGVLKNQPAGRLPGRHGEVHEVYCFNGGRQSVGQKGSVATSGPFAFQGRAYAARMPMTVVEVLRAARAKIEKPGTWCQGHYAEDAHGSAWSAEEAKSFCALGAIYEAAFGEVTSGDAIDVLRASIGGSGVAPWNDDLTRTQAEVLAAWNDDPTRTQAEVLAAFDRAIAAAEKAS